MKILTRELALTLTHRAELTHGQIRNKDGSPLRARVNGKIQTWKTRPTEWRLPVKYGLKSCFDITQDNCAYWFVG